MDLEMLLLICCSALIGAIIQGITGFAYGIIMLLILPHFFTYTDALVLVTFTSIFLLGYNAFLYRKDIVWAHIPVAFGVFLTTDFVAIRLLKYTGSDPIWSKFLGVIFVCLAIYLFYGQDKIKIQATWQNTVLFNGIGGILNGFFGVGGPIVVLYFFSVLTDKKAYISTTQMMFFLTIVVEFFMRWGSGMVTWPILQYGLSCIAFIVVGLLIGKKLFAIIQPSTAKKIICLLMAINGFLLVLK